ncbi:hypothetical protein BGW38_010967, partial [Lunasporangiospora selenospora]
MHRLSKFVFSSVLNEDPILKTLTLLGTLPSDELSTEETGEPNEAPAVQQAILLIEKTHFASQSTERNIAKRITELIPTGNNDIYHWWNALLASGEASDPDLKMTIIFPATETRKMITETPEIYKTSVLPWIEGQPAGRIQWVYNILSGVKEAENVLMRDDDPEIGFVVLPDSKWDKRTLSSLYLLAISQRRDVRSLRDLRPEHLPMLKNIRDKVLATVPERFPGVAQDEVRLFVHYHPSYYHFHVHITYLNAMVPGSTVGQSHLLDTIIDNIESIDPEYYSKASIRYALGVNHPVYDL